MVIESGSSKEKLCSIEIESRNRVVKFIKIFEKSENFS